MSYAHEEGFLMPSDNNDSLLLYIFWGLGGGGGGRKKLLSTFPIHLSLVAFSSSSGWQMLLAAWLAHQQVWILLPSLPTPPSLPTKELQLVPSTRPCQGNSFWWLFSSLPLSVSYLVGIGCIFMMFSGPQLASQRRHTLIKHGGSGAGVSLSCPAVGHAGRSWDWGPLSTSGLSEIVATCVWPPQCIWLCNEEFTFKHVTNHSVILLKAITVIPFNTVKQIYKRNKELRHECIMYLSLRRQEAM